jgi:hypothetical protein
MNQKQRIALGHVYAPVEAIKGQLENEMEAFAAWDVLKAALDDLTSTIKSTTEEEQEKYKNMPESLQSGSKGDELQEVISNLEQAQSYGEDVDTALEGKDPQEIIDALNNLLSTIGDYVEFPQPKKGRSKQAAQPVSDDSIPTVDNGDGSFSVALPQPALPDIRLLTHQPATPDSYVASRVLSGAWNPENKPKEQPTEEVEVNETEIAALVSDVKQVFEKYLKGKLATMDNKQAIEHTFQHDELTEDGVLHRLVNKYGFEATVVMFDHFCKLVDPVVTSNKPKQKRTSGTPGARATSETRNGARKPQRGICREVWDYLADQTKLEAITNEQGEVIEYKAGAVDTKKLKEEATARGWNVNNVSCELAAWRKFHGFSARAK